MVAVSAPKCISDPADEPILSKDAADQLFRRDEDFDAFKATDSLGIPAPESKEEAKVVLVAVPESKEGETKKETQSRYVSPKDFELLKVIGMGAFGKVLQVRNKKSRQILAMKVISKRLLRRRSGYIENVQAERNILTKVRHPFVVTMHCSFQSSQKLFIIMDFLAGGELFLRLGREGIFRESTAAFYLAEIILALDHLHSLNILHRDLKPENVLLGSDGHVVSQSVATATAQARGLSRWFWLSTAPNTFSLSVLPILVSPKTLLTMAACGETKMRTLEP
jgi:serine/threonine protein kinase